MIHTVFIDKAIELARRANTGTELPNVGLKIRTAQTIAFAFMTSGTVAAVAGWSSGKCVIKAKPSCPVLLIDTTLDAAGAGSDTRYNAVWTAATLDGPADGALREFMGDSTEPKECWCEVEWVDAAGTHSVSFPIMLIPTLNDPEDEAPPPADSASWEWIKDRAPEAKGFTHDDSTRTLGVPSVAAQTSAANEKTTPADADKVPLIDSAAAGALKWLSWARIIVALRTAFDSVYSTFDGGYGSLTGVPATFAPAAHTQAISTITGLQGALDAKIATAQRGAIDGVAPLDSGGKVPAANLPSYVDDVIEAANFAALPGSGETGKIYVTLDDGKVYRWSGSVYVALNEMPAFASQAEAEAGSDNSKMMTPLRTAEAIAALAGGGVGSALIRGSGALLGHTTPAVDATGVADLYLHLAFGPFATFQLNLNGVVFNFTLTDTDPSDGTIWLDASFNAANVMMAKFAEAVNALSRSGISASAGNDGLDYLLITNSETGDDAVTSLTTSEPGYYVITGGGSGADAVPASGAVTEVILIAQDGVKAVRPVKIAMSGDGALSPVSVQIAFKVGSDYFPVAEMVNGATVSGDVIPGAYFAEWITPRPSSALVGRYSDTPPLGGTLNVWAIAEQN